MLSGFLKKKSRQEIIKEILANGKINKTIEFYNVSSFVMYFMFLVPLKNTKYKYMRFAKLNSCNALKKVEKNSYNSTKG